MRLCFLKNSDAYLLSETEFDYIDGDLFISTGSGNCYSETVESG